MRIVTSVLMTCVLLLAAGTAAVAEADGPDYWAVVGVARGDVLNMRAEPNAASRIVGRIPAGAMGLRNLGCRGIPSFEEWQRMSEAEKRRSARSRWCRVEFQGRIGWVAGRFLREGGPPR